MQAVEAEDAVEREEVPGKKYPRTRKTKK